jgi:hypothetical protein
MHSCEAVHVAMMPLPAVQESSGYYYLRPKSIFNGTLIEKKTLLWLGTSHESSRPLYMPFLHQYFQ